MLLQLSVRVDLYTTFILSMYKACLHNLCLISALSKNFSFNISFTANIYKSLTDDQYWLTIGLADKIYANLPTRNNLVTIFLIFSHFYAFFRIIADSLVKNNRK